MSIVPQVSGRCEQQGRGASGAGSPGAEGRVPAVVRSLGAVGKLQPPSSNTGARNTGASSQGVEISVDYLSWTYPAMVPLERVLSDLEPVDGDCEWVPTERGAHGYRQGLARGDVRVFHDGNADMGVYVCLKGQGCRQFEAEQHFRDEADWRKFLGVQLAQGAKFTRFDPALDDRDDLFPALTMERVRTAISNGEVVSRFKEADPSGRVVLGGERIGERTGDVVHFGSIMSEVSVCIYDKAKEQLLSDSIHWVRCELRAKKDRAQALVAAFVEEGAAAVVSVLYGYLDFKEKGEDSNRSRWRTAYWWEAFLEGCNKARLVVTGVKRTVERMYKWLSDQVAPSLAVLVAAGGGAIDDLLRLVDDGRSRLRRSHRSMLAAYGMEAYATAGGRLPV